MTKYLKRTTRTTRTKFTVLYDNREEGNGKCPWIWLSRYYGPMEKTHLKTADYTIAGMEKKIAIERKSGIEELFKDLTASYRPTFKRFLTRLSKFPHKIILVEDILTPERVSSILRDTKYRSNGRSRLTIRTLQYWLAEITTVYGIPVLFIGQNNHYTIRRVFENCYIRGKSK